MRGAGKPEAELRHQRQVQTVRVAERSHHSGFALSPNAVSAGSPGASFMAKKTATAPASKVTKNTNTRRTPKRARLPNTIAGAQAAFVSLR